MFRPFLFKEVTTILQFGKQVNTEIAKSEPSKDKDKWYRYLQEVDVYSDEWKQRYLDYVSSEDWRVKAAKHLAKYPFCQECYDNVELGVYHANVENIGREQAKDLIVLCELCFEERSEEAFYEHEFDSAGQPNPGGTD